VQQLAAGIRATPALVTAAMLAASPVRRKASVRQWDMDVGEGIVEG
jgi:hypothetical protein